eukprot:jgi/Tetstr1/424414/TSEL_014972.t1
MDADGATVGSDWQTVPVPGRRRPQPRPITATTGYSAVPAARQQRGVGGGGSLGGSWRGCGSWQGGSGAGSPLGSPRTATPTGSYGGSLQRRSAQPREHQRGAGRQHQRRGRREEQRHGSEGGAGSPGGSQRESGSWLPGSDSPLGSPHTAASTMGTSAGSPKRRWAQPPRGSGSRAERTRTRNRTRAKAAGRSHGPEAAAAAAGQRAKALEMLTQRCLWIDTAGCALPAPGELFTAPHWELPAMAQEKAALGAAKDKLDCFDLKEWERLASRANRAEQIRYRLRREYSAEMATVAWAKMFESLGSLGLLEDDHSAAQDEGEGEGGGEGDGARRLFTAHLCEAPGAFICAINHYIATQHPAWRWDWLAVTLNPHYEGNDQFAMVDDDRLINATAEHWCYGDDNSGDIHRQANIRHVWERAAERCAAACVRDRGAALVTADGAVDTTLDPNNQEALTASIHYCELVAALGLLAPGGNFLLKAFTLYEHTLVRHSAPHGGDLRARGGVQARRQQTRQQRGVHRRPRFRERLPEPAALGRC